MVEVLFGNNQFDALDNGVLSGYESMDAYFHRTRGGRSIKSSKKVQKIQWSMASGRENRGSEGRGGRGPLN